MKKDSDNARKSGVTDYKVYYMKPYETAAVFMIGAGIGVAVVQVFFGYLLLDIIVGLLVGVIAIPIGRNVLLSRRLNRLLLQFKDMLDSLNTSYSVGKTTQAAFQDAYDDLVLMYGKKSDICVELNRINMGIMNAVTIEDLLADFAERSGLEDIKTFSDVFEAINRKGGNIQNIIGDTRSMICDKIEIEQDIKTITSSSSNSLYVIMVMPVLIVPMMSGFADGGDPVTDILAKVAAIVLFAIAFVVGKKITTIKF